MAWKKDGSPFKTWLHWVYMKFLGCMFHSLSCSNAQVASQKKLDSLLQIKARQFKDEQKNTLSGQIRPFHQPRFA